MSDAARPSESESSQAEDPTERELLWRQYELWMDLYRFHMDLVLKANGLFFIVTGGILTFYFANPMQPLVRFALLLPVVMSTAIAAVFAYGAHLSLQHRADVRDLASQLKFRVAPDVNAMRVLFWASAIVHALIATSLGIVVATAPPN